MSYISFVPVFIVSRFIRGLCFKTVAVSATGILEISTNEIYKVHKKK